MKRVAGPKGLILICEHWTPEYWEADGFQRNWGDAAIMNEGFEVLRRQNFGDIAVEYVILCPEFLRRPARYYARGSIVHSWGSY